MNKTPSNTRRLLGAEVPDKKRIVIALQGIYGIGQTRAYKICNDLEIDLATRSYELDDAVLYKISSYILEKEDWLIGPNLRRFETERIMSEIAEQTHRGKLHQRGLPVRTSRGARNGRTARRLARHKTSK